MKVLGQNMGRVVQCWLQRTCVYFGGFYVCTSFGENRSRNRPWECAQTDRYTDAHTQTSFIICLILYAIAMGQIITVRNILLQQQQCLYVSY